MDAPVPKVLIPVLPACTCGLPIKYRCAQVLILGPVTFDLGDMTLTLCVPDGDGSTPHGALTNLVSFYLVVIVVIITVIIVVVVVVVKLCAHEREASWHLTKMNLNDP